MAGNPPPPPPTKKKSSRATLKYLRTNVSWLTDSFCELKVMLCVLQVLTNVPSWCDRVLRHSFPQTKISSTSYGECIYSAVKKSEKSGSSSSRNFPALSGKWCKVKALLNPLESFPGRKLKAALEIQTSSIAKRRTL